MKDLIRKILRESTKISSDAPDWVKKFHELSREERIEDIKKRKKELERIIPKIVEFFKSKFGQDLVDLVVKEKGVHYGSESHSDNKILLDFRFSDKIPDVRKLKQEVFRDLRSFFNLDIEYYGLPLDLEFHKATWEKF
jgi:hypothetical protein